MARRSKPNRGDAKDLVRARDQCIEAAFSSKCFLLDFYQREYVWGDQQVNRLTSDLSRKF